MEISAEEEEEEYEVIDTVEGGSLNAATFGIIKGAVGPAILCKCIAVSCLEASRTQALRNGQVCRVSLDEILAQFILQLVLSILNNIPINNNTAQSCLEDSNLLVGLWLSPP